MSTYFICVEACVDFTFILWVSEVKKPELCAGDTLLAVIFFFYTHVL